MRQRVHLIVDGRVQGVCYRMFARDEAVRLGLNGWVRNLPDGSVEAVAEGEMENVLEFVRACRNGPPLARVTRLDDVYSDPAGELDAFRITY